MECWVLPGPNTPILHYSVCRRGGKMSVFGAWLLRRRERGPAADPGPTPGGAPVFISGCNRGGTTILAKLLGRHPDLCNIGEGHAFTEGQYIWRKRFPDTRRHRWAVA